ncbi:MAG: PTS system mannose/fructose/sorbose family transporter subunit IID [Anaerolineales bacterium]|jgi:mannose/fructose/N-acetylgalactosamine-specific phosphotransferase system component IID
MEHTEAATSDVQVTKRDLWILYFRSFFLQSSFSFERMQGVGLTWMFHPLIKKLYKNVEDRAQALKRHLVFFNTNPLTGSIIAGMIAAMEEKNANGELEDTSTINSLKGALIGPLAGIGDSFFLLVFVMLLGIAVDFSMQGNATGVIILTVVVGLIWYLGVYYGVTQGYYRGEALLERLTGKESEVFMGGMGIVGAMVVGALVAVFVNVITPIGDGLFQEQLDGVLPGLLPLGFTLLAYRLLKRGWPSVWVMILILVLGMVLGHFGVIGQAAALLG